MRQVVSFRGCINVVQINVVIFHGNDLSIEGPLHMYYYMLLCYVIMITRAQNKTSYFAVTIGETLYCIIWNKWVKLRSQVLDPVCLTIIFVALSVTLLCNSHDHQMTNIQRKEGTFLFACHTCSIASAKPTHIFSHSVQALLVVLYAYYPDRYLAIVQIWINVPELTLPLSGINALAAEHNFRSIDDGDT
jgi:hypothetical protein